jgi:hypothetical protein
MAYMQCIIPQPYCKFSIWDFDGCCQEKQLLDGDIALRAKQQLVKYCWDDITLGDIQKLQLSEQKSSIDAKTAMPRRRKLGHNVVICADNREYSSDSKDPAAKPTGKTFVASLIIKEAIKLRALTGHADESYGWISFSALTGYLKKEDPALMYVRGVDWLVVDDIPNNFNASATSQSYISSVLDSFFLDRVEDKLPTILVFRFDVKKHAVRWEEQYGIGISRMVNNPNTTIISLS